MSGLTKQERWLVILVLAMLLTGAVVRHVRRGGGDASLDDGVPQAVEGDRGRLWSAE